MFSGEENERDQLIYITVVIRPGERNVVQNSVSPEYWREFTVVLRKMAIMKVCKYKMGRCREKPEFTKNCCALHVFSDHIF